MDLSNPLITLMDNYEKTGFAMSLAFHPNGLMIAVGYENNIVNIWKNDGKWNLIQSLVPKRSNTRKFIQTLAFNNNYLVSGDTRGKIKIWSTASWVREEISSKSQSHTQAINGIAFNGTENSFASVSDDNKILIWKRDESTLTWSVVKEIYLYNNKLLSNKIKCVSFRVDGKYLLYGITNSVQVMETTNWKIEGLPNLTLSNGNNVYSIATSPDKKYIAVGTDQENILIWKPNSEIEMTKNVQTLYKNQNVEKSIIRSVVFSTDSKYMVASCGQANKIIIFKNGNGDKWDKLIEYNFEEEVFGIAFSPDGKTLAVALSNGEVKLYSFEPTNDPDPIPPRSNQIGGKKKNRSTRKSKRSSSKRSSNKRSSSKRKTKKRI